MAKRYDQMFPLIAQHRPRKIVEVGVHRALRAAKLCQEALKYRDWVSYTGYDVFETMSPKFQEAALNGKGTALQAQAEGRLRAVHGLDWKLIGLMNAFDDTVYLSPWPALSDYLNDEVQFDEDGVPIPGSETPRTRVPHEWGGYHSWPEL